MNLKDFKKLTLSSKNKEIAYLQSGNGPVILFIHGFGVGATIWEQVGKILSSRFSIILLDLPGYGLNSNLRINPSIDYLTQFIFDFINKKGTVDFLVGYSMGGVFAYQIAKNPSSSLKKIIIVSSPFFFSPNVVFGQLFKTIGSSLMITQLVKFLVKRFPVKQLLFLTGGLASITNPKAMNECMRLFMKEPNSPYIFTFAATIFSQTKLATISIPIEFIYGERDGLAKIKMAKKIQSYCKNSDLKVVKDVYHLMPLEKPRELAKLISSFCLNL